MPKQLNDVIDNPTFIFIQVLSLRALEHGNDHNINNINNNSNNCMYVTRTLFALHDTPSDAIIFKQQFKASNFYDIRDFVDLI